MKYPTREQWLEAAVKSMTPLFKQTGYDVPAVRVTCGWPSHGGTSKKKRTIGQCWDSSASSDGLHQIFISPYLDTDVTDPGGVLSTLVHEVVHAVVGIDQRHNKVFGKCARAVGLEGKLTSTIAGETLMCHIKDWSTALGEYPHAKLDPTQSPVKKQSTRMIKMECRIDECGYVARTSKKWLDDAGPCLCPRHKKPMEFELPETDGGDE